ncbi:Alpha/Beta hydrolase protein [Phascolomyces articulosus]|uniref:Alpha/Beta hydrolase protein n=1 Tax=Phascolomyces articulosus TaxID=60185 RepID=A0AAD5PBA7_9FUNG|nr:Alpha/Beta hydrolase protein [Phascolomyces articulosus]
MFILRVLIRNNISYSLHKRKIIQQWPCINKPPPSQQQQQRSLSSWGTAFLIVAGVPAGLYLYKCIMLVLFQNKLIYMGYIPPGSRHEQCTPDKIPSNLNITEQTIQTPDRKQLKGFVVERKQNGNTFSMTQDLPSQQEEQRRPIIIYFQGNAGNMIHRFDLFNKMLQAVPEATIIGICPRGFGSSSGRSSERGLEIDAQCILHYASSSSAFDIHRPIYIYGHSLGGGVAIGLLAKNVNQQQRIHGLILENTYTSILDMVKTLYPRYTPYPLIAKYFLWNHWPSLTRIHKIKTPILFLSSEKDEIVPAEHMQKLYNKFMTMSGCSDGSRMVKFPRSTHMDIYQVESVAFKSALHTFINDNNNKVIDKQ